ncbi:hypothetical protein C8T65DRAFT_700266, partial [Cerioporus squamosus]
MQCFRLGKASACLKLSTCHCCLFLLNAQDQAQCIDPYAICSHFSKREFARALTGTSSMAPTHLCAAVVHTTLNPVNHAHLNASVPESQQIHARMYLTTSNLLPTLISPNIEAIHVHMLVHSPYTISYTGHFQLNVFEDHIHHRLPPLKMQPAFIDLTSMGHNLSMAILPSSKAPLMPLKMLLSTYENSATRAYISIAFRLSFCSGSSPTLLRGTPISLEPPMSAADGFPLWTQIDVTSVEKAKSSPGHATGNFAKMLPHFTTRLRTLVVKVPNTATISYLMAHLHSPVPHLKILHILGKVASDKDRHTVNLLKASCNLSWNPKIYSGLSVLELRILRMHIPSQMCILEILKQCPGLEPLHLELPALIRPIIPKDDPAWNVSLPSLSACTLVSLLHKHLGSLLSHLLPQASYHHYGLELTSASATETCDPRPATSRPPTEPKYRSSEAQKHRPPPSYCRLRSPIKKPDLRLWILTSRIIGGLGDPIFELEISIASEADEVLSVFPQNFKMTKLEMLVVSGIYIEESLDIWWDIFRKLRTLHLVSLDWETMSGAFEVLGSWEAD